MHAPLRPTAAQERLLHLDVLRGFALLGSGFFGLQVGLSAWWLQRFRFGPAEWLWRSLTYLRPQPLLRRRGS
jgi:uncharacterized membrane protein YeiB